MGNEQALDHLEAAMREIKAARQEAERDITETELKNLERIAQGCKDGILSDQLNS